MFLTSLSAHISFSQLSGIFLTKKQLTCLQKLFFMSHKSIRQQPSTPNFKCLVPKHVTSGTLWEHDFLLRVHTSMQPRVVVKTFFSILALPYTLSAHSLPLSTKRFQHLFSNKSITNQQRWLWDAQYSGCAKTYVYVDLGLESWRVKLLTQYHVQQGQQRTQQTNDEWTKMSQSMTSCGQNKIFPVFESRKTFSSLIITWKLKPIM